jgi:sulfane dehydrogenase subunit SoxC
MRDLKKRNGNSKVARMTSKTTPSRRKFLKTALAGAGVAAAAAPARAEDFITPAMTTPGKAFTAYGMPSPHEDVKRLLRPPGISPGTGGSQAPLESLEGIITPSGLHFERHHNGVPDIDPKTHKFLIHGLVKTPLEFSMDALMRYPRVSRMHFVECGGNSGANAGPQPPQVTAGGIHGLVSCSEWTGIELGPLLEEAGVQPEGKWILAESGDAASLSRSVPLAEAKEQGILALFQNGERLRPEQGYPLRLLMPGWEGNLNIKWLHRIKVTPGPTMAKDETSKYTQSLKDGKARQFNFIMPVKSVITRPSGNMTMNGPGFYEISGIAWSGHGKITKVEISMDGGATWTDAEMPGPVLPKCLTRFRLPWQWDGKPCVLQSRSTDDQGNLQPTRAAWKAPFSNAQFYQYNAIQSWQIGADNTVKNTYA